MTKHRQGDQTIAAKDLRLGEDTLVSGAGEDSVAGEDSGLSTGYEGGRDELHDSVAPASGGLTPDISIEALTLSDVAGKDLLLVRIDEVFERHVRNIQPAPLHLAGLAAEGGSQA